MSGDPGIVWLCLVSGMLLQLTYMVLPLQRWDWARYLGSAALPVIMMAKLDSTHVALNAESGLYLCGTFTFAFAMLFQDRLLPRLGEGVILMWTVVLLCVIAELGAWRSVPADVALGMGLAALALLIVPRTLPYVVKLALYGWFLLAVVAMGVLQFRASDFSLMMSGRTDQLDYVLALIDGLAGAYIGVHAAFLFELLPIPGKGERWTDFKARWQAYLDQVVSRFDDQRLGTAVALALVVGITLLALVNHVLGLMPDRTLANLVLFGLPIAWRGAASWRMRHQPAAPLASAVSPAPPAAEDAAPHEGIGRARHSRKHRQ